MKPLSEYTPTEQHEFVRAWNRLADERDAEEREKWPLRREDRAKAKVAA